MAHVGLHFDRRLVLFFFLLLLFFFKYTNNLTTEDIFPVNVDELVPVRSGVLVEKSQRVHDFMDDCSNPHAAITNGNNLLATLGFASNSWITP